ncbi:MAG TPA: ABC transporter permease [Acidimicrobiales bacterium]|nr:ABC transporter permease [Acidimicrobiales bacterium]
MTTAIAPVRLAPADRHTKAMWTVLDSLAVARRNVIAMFRTPQILVFSTIQPILFVLMFRYVFGGAIHIPGVSYVDYLMAGVFVQTVTFGAVQTGVGLADDLQKGLIERFRSLPMARSAVLAGRTLADTLRNLFVIILMIAVGFAVGFRLHTNVGELLAAIVIMLLFGFALSWVMAVIGLGTRNAEAAQAAAFPLLALLVFASNAFVSTQTMPRFLRDYANHQPVSATATAIRSLVLGGPTMSHVLVALAWSAGIVLVFAPFAVARYRKTA